MILEDYFSPNFESRVILHFGFRCLSIEDSLISRYMAGNIDNFYRLARFGVSERRKGGVQVGVS